VTGKDWDSLPTEQKRVLLDQMPPSDLARQYSRAKEFFQQAKSFFAGLPRQTQEPSQETHYPPKDLIVSARRDLSFYEANFELIDNSIDEWRRRGGQKELSISIQYDLDLLTGVYKDNAGGMDQKDVFRVFIPGETSNRDYRQRVIGSFGMGAKKGIFRLTDGAKIVSSPDGKVSYTSEVPEKWELEKSWVTRDGQAEPIPACETHLYFFKLVNPPTQFEIDELRRRAGIVYAPLLSGELGNLTGEPKALLKITVNGGSVVATSDIIWANPEGAEPATYDLSQQFPDTMSMGGPVPLRFIFRCGILTNQPGLKPGRESDFGIDVYGNGRLIQRHLQEPFGFGTKGLGKRVPGTTFVRGKLFIIGHSAAIPWDTHKREYLVDHPVSEWLRGQVRPVIKAYADAASKFTEAGTTAARTELAETRFTPEAAKPTIVLSPGQGPTAAVLPKLAKPVKTDDNRSKRPTRNARQQPSAPEPEEITETAAEVAEAIPEHELVTLEFTSAEYDDLCSRFEVESTEALQDAVHDCLVGGVAFALEEDQLARALKKLKCEGGVGELCEKIRGLLLKKL